MIGQVVCGAAAKPVAIIHKRWIYRIDPKRVNEYGQVLAEETSGESKKDK